MEKLWRKAKCDTFFKTFIEKEKNGVSLGEILSDGKMALCPERDLKRK